MWAGLVLLVITLLAAPALLALFTMQFYSVPMPAPALPERLHDRALVAVYTSEGVFLSWRLLPEDRPSISFHLRRDSHLVAATAQTNYLDREGTSNSTYTVTAVVRGHELPASLAVSVLTEGFLTLPLQKPPAGESPNGEVYTYQADDASLGDLDGDGVYEIVVKWEPTNRKDNSQDGFTGLTYLDGYRLNGTLLWRISLGVNVRAGPHYTQFMVFDLDGDNRAEVALRTADGTTDGLGQVIGDPTADHREQQGRILKGPEFLTIFSGLTGEALVTVDFLPRRGEVTEWGDTNGNRADRFLAAIAYLDGQRPSLITARGYYTKALVVAWDFRDGQLVRRWEFNSRAYSGCERKGNHNLNVADVDMDGKDEIVYGAMVIDDDGRSLFCTGWGHGDSLHTAKLDPSLPGLQTCQDHEHSNISFTCRDAGTGRLLWSLASVDDSGRSMVADVDPRYPGQEVWVRYIPGLYTAYGRKITENAPATYTFSIWWDGDLLREQLNSTSIYKWDYEREQDVLLLTAAECATNTQKATPSLQADFLGDWREEVVWRNRDSTAFHIYTTTHPTAHRLPTLMSDHNYRLAIAWQNVGYNQVPHLSYFLGHNMQPLTRPGTKLSER